LAQYGGVYRGMVTNTADPQSKGRVQVRLTGIMAATSWAPVCTAVGAPRNTVPPIGSTVIVAFENGDAQHPVVLGAIQA
jgi:uncharacterized protein involved in type VI secretion and phage assembly